MAVKQMTEYPDQGSNFGQDASDKIGFHGATPIVQQTDASQVAITDSTGGTVADTLAAGVGKVILPIFIQLAELADGEVINAFTPGFKGKILSLDFFTEKAVTTGSKLSSLNAEIGTTNVTGGVVALTSANCTPKGVKKAGTAVTALNTFSATDTISIEAASTTAFSEGTGWLFVTMQNMDTADAFASLADKWNELRSVLVTSGLISGAA